MRGILRTGLIGFVVLGSVTVADEVRAAPAAGVTARTVDRPAPASGMLKGVRLATVTS
ncbi:hypothetical protein Apa02nite_097260 [Actinoplanes palleronii]|uniref:Uncharacterized protein n=1 Tax=Actinoplanes palleronii TaxID=113570 RepID=A0ABQ4BSF4_9ACTN|nr:hypothetical protein Apa02nite_097260 [Actinoplanes palleronii]